MCVQYWPAGKNREEIYSGIGVTVENEEQLANFMIRTIRMRKVRNKAGAEEGAKKLRGNDVYASFNLYLLGCNLIIL